MALNVVTCRSLSLIVLNFLTKGLHDLSRNIKNFQQPDIENDVTHFYDVWQRNVLSTSCEKAGTYVGASARACVFEQPCVHVLCIPERVGAQLRNRASKKFPPEIVFSAQRPGARPGPGRT